MTSPAEHNNLGTPGIATRPVDTLGIGTARCVAIDADTWAVQPMDDWSVWRRSSDRTRAQLVADGFATADDARRAAGRA